MNFNKYIKGIIAYFIRLKSQYIENRDKNIKTYLKQNKAKRKVD
jgi:hypothetical protein